MMAFLWRKTLGEIRPDIAVPGMMTDTERCLWNLFFENNPDILKSRF